MRGCQGWKVYHACGTLCINQVAHLGDERMEIVLLQYGPAVLALLIAGALQCTRRHHHVALPQHVRRWTAVGMIASLGLLVYFMAWSIMPDWLPPLGDDSHLYIQLARYIGPLVIGVLAVALLIIPAPAPGPSGTAALAPRTFMTFTSGAWLVTALGVAAVAVAAAVFAGLASSPDENGRHTMFTVQMTAENSAGVSIYGWWFSVPCLVLIAAIAVSTLVAHIVISRPALHADARHDTDTRSARIRNILAVGTGTLLIHLSVVLQSLADSSSMSAGFSVGRAGWVEFGTSFAAIGPALSWASLISIVVGMTMWWWVLLSTLPIRAHQPSTAVLA